MSLKSPNKSECVKVIVRCRPMSEKEVAEEHEQIIEISPERGMIELSNVKHDNERKQYTFDAVYDWNSKQIDLYEEIFRPLVESVLEGFNGTIFAYGQTGTGKTFTMEGIRDNPELRGVIPNSFEHIFSHISRSQHQQYLVRSSYLEIYQEEIRDLLAKDQTKRFELKERPDIGIYVKDLSSFVCKSIKEIEHVMTVGNQNRSVGATNMNEHSSRSHAIFMITIEHSSMGVDGENHIRVGKLNLVDLAGSERQGKTGAVGQRQKEAIKINLSLSALGNVISALVDGSTHVPYRDSKLTRLLQDSLGGNAKTVMVANIGPASYNYEETLTTLRYANRAKNIKNRPRVNEDPKDALLREFQSEIERLKDQLDERRKKKTRSINGELTCEDNQMIQNNDSPASSFDQEAIEKLQSKIAAMESKLLCGGKDIIDHTVEQQVELERRRSELAEQKRREIEVKQRLDEEDEKNMEIKETFTSMQQEVEIKRRNLRKIVNKLQFVKTEIRDVQEVNALERRELEQMQNDLMKELKLKYLMINNFIPPEEKNKLLSRVVFDEDEDNWKVLKQSNNSRNNNMIIFECPSSCYGYRYPISDYAKMAATVGSSARFKSENIMDVELEMPERMTRDYNAPVLSPRVRAALDNALKGENDEIEITGTNNDLFKPVGRNRNHLSVDQNQLPSNISHTRPSSTKVFKVASHSKKMVRNLSNRPDTAYYPQARGLIRK